MWVFLNGRFVEETQACIPIHDRGFLYGDGVFETMRVYNGRLFRAAAHLQRMVAGLRYLDIQPRLASEELLAVLRVLIVRNRVGDGVARIYQTRDSLLVQARAQEFAARELTVVVSNVVVDPQLSKFKTANRLPYILAQQHAQRHGADEALLLGSQGQAVELTTCNLFAVFDDELWTPPLSDGALPGVTRAAVLELARSLRMKVREQSFRPSRLEEANEAFATNSLVEIAPIRNWSKTNRVTTRLQKAFRELVEREIETFTQPVGFGSALS